MNAANIDNKIALARAIIRKKWPYLMSTVYGLIPRPFDDTPTMFTTQGMVLAYNPEYVASLKPEVLATALLHEASHHLRGFWSRIPQSADIALYNIASDLPINSDLKDSGWEVDPDWFFPETFEFPKGKTAEEYYKMLLDLRKKNPKKLSDKEGQDGVCKGSCRSPSQQIETMLDSELNEKGERIGRSEVDRNRLIRRTIEETSSHAKARGRGSVPGFMHQLIDYMEVRSRVHWRDRLSSLIMMMSGPIISGGDDYSLRHPSKRSYVRKIIRPGLVDAQIVPLFVLDTSGSMDEKMMWSGIGETCQVLQQLGVDEGYLCMADAGVAMQPKQVRLTDLQRPMTFHGRGGTDFRPAFRCAESMVPRPDLIFYWTDGDGWADPEPCPIPTIWGIIHSRYCGRRTRRPAPWGYVVTITEDASHPDDDEEDFIPPQAPPA